MSSVTWLRREYRVEPESSTHYLGDLFQGGNGSLTGGKRGKRKRKQAFEGRAEKQETRAKKCLSEAHSRSIIFKR